LTVTWLARIPAQKRRGKLTCASTGRQSGAVSPEAFMTLSRSGPGGLNGLVHIGIDETSYRKGHKYITVIVNHDTNTVVWVADGHGKSVLEQFYKALTDEQLSSIKVVTGDGARWITDCVNEFTPDCERCALIHSMWSNGPWRPWTKSARIAGTPLMRRLSSFAAKKTRRSVAARRQMTKPQQRYKEARDAGFRTQAVCTYSLGKAPENLTENQKIRLDMIQANDPKLYRAYCNERIPAAAV
jgi:hypothetical protein